MFLDLITASAPHIYISALPLSPRTSLVREMYKRHQRPLVRVVQGLSTSWEVVVTSIYLEVFDGTASWSPCNRFIAVARFGVVEIRDAVTLSLLNTFESPWAFHPQLSFSPDSRFLTCFGEEDVVSWDLQTGGSVRVGTTLLKGMHLDRGNFSSTCSTDRKMLAFVYSGDLEDAFIASHDSSTAHANLYRVLEGRLIPPIWTHGEFLRFTTIKPGSITIQEVDFTLTRTPEVVESLPTPDEITDTGSIRESLFLPTLSRLAMAFEDELLVWNARDSKILLKTQGPYTTHMSFSSDGRFFACRNSDSVHVWKESPTGYVLHQKLAFSPNKGPFLSPNGESIIASLLSTIHLWYTEDPILSGGSIPASTKFDFFMEFSPHEAFAAFGRYWDPTIIILDLQSGDPRLEIDNGEEVRCLGVTESSIVVVSSCSVSTWDLATKTTTAVTRITQPDPLPNRASDSPFLMSISPDLSRVASVRWGSESKSLEIYDVFTGRRLACAVLGTGVSKSLPTPDGFRPLTLGEGIDFLHQPWFTPDRREIWLRSDSYILSADRWEIVEGDGPGTVKLRPVGMAACPPGVPPWQPPRGYRVTGDGWILSPTQQRLLWLPHRWRSIERNRAWGGRFLGLLHPELLEVVILEFLD